jgi:hypothetical protein
MPLRHRHSRIIAHVEVFKLAHIIASQRTNHNARAPRAARWNQHFAHYLTRPILMAGPMAFAIAVVAVIGYAWLIKDEGYWTAETGLGYWLGIVGSLMMLALIAYPLRKRFRIFHGLGRVASYFRIHMIFGILGPTLIVLHSNFKLGSLNSRLALLTMLVVVASGIVGRYLYSQVHRGLYGLRADVREIFDDATILAQQLGNDVDGGAEVQAALADFNARLSQRPTSLLGQCWRACTIYARVATARRRVLGIAQAALTAQARSKGWSRSVKRERMKVFRHHLSTYFAATKKAERLALFERMFGLWHVLHMPLFVLLALTVVIHIVAVHLY